jgi:protein SCO1/2
LRGQVLAVDAAREELTVKHDDIRGFMPGMTMPFKVRPAAAVRERKPGDLIRATLVVAGTNAYLTDVAATGHAPIAESAPRPLTDLLEPGSIVPDESFTDQNGTVRRLSAYRPRVVAVTFTYTRCPLPDYCPLLDRHFAAVQREIAADSGLRGRAQLVSISLDPAFDTPAVLAAHAARVGADPDVWHFLTGDAAAIQRFAVRFGVTAMRPEPASPELVHNLRTGVINKDGHLVAVMTGNTWTPADLVQALKGADAIR